MQALHIGKVISLIVLLAIAGRVLGQDAPPSNEGGAASNEAPAEGQTPAQGTGDVVSRGMRWAAEQADRMDRLLRAGGGQAVDTGYDHARGVYQRETGNDTLEDDLNEDLREALRDLPVRTFETMGDGLRYLADAWDEWDGEPPPRGHVEVGEVVIERDPPSGAERPSVPTRSPITLDETQITVPIECGDPKYPKPCFGPSTSDGDEQAQQPTDCVSVADNDRFEALPAYSDPSSVCGFSIQNCQLNVDRLPAELASGIDMWINVARMNIDYYCGLAEQLCHVDLCEYPRRE